MASSFTVTLTIHGKLIVGRLSKGDSETFLDIVFSIPNSFPNVYRLASYFIGTIQSTRLYNISNLQQKEYIRGNTKENNRISLLVMLTFRALAALLLLYPAFTNAQDPGANGADTPPAVIPGAISPPTATLSTTVVPTLPGVPLLMPTSVPAPPDANNEIQFGAPDNGDFDKSVLRLEVNGKRHVFGIDLELNTTLLFTQNFCEDGQRPFGKDSNCTIYHDGIGTAGVRPSSRSYADWIFGVGKDTRKFKVGNLPDIEIEVEMVINPTDAKPDKHLGITFSEYFRGVQGIIGLGNGSTLLTALGKSSAGYSLYMGDNEDGKIQGSLVLGGYDSAQISGKTAKLFNGLDSLTLKKFARFGGINIITNEINVKLDASYPNILLPQSLEKEIREEFEQFTDEGLRIKYNENLPEIDLEFSNGLNLTLKRDHYANSNADFTAVQFNGSKEEIIFGRPFFHAAYFGNQGNGRFVIGPATPSDSGELESFDVINREIAAATQSGSSGDSSSDSDSKASSPPLTSGSKTNVGAIVGGVIGGLAFIAILALLFFCCRRRRLNRAFSGRKRGMSKEFDEDEMARGINGTDSFGSNVAPTPHQNAYSPVPLPAQHPTELQEVKNHPGIATYDTSPVVPSNANLSVGAAPVGAATVGSTATTAANSPTNSPLESKRFSAFSGINRKPVPQRASRQVDVDSDDDEISMRSPQSDRRAPSPPADSNRNSFGPREVPRLPFTFNRGSSDSPGL